MDKNARGAVMCSEILSLVLQSREGRECRLKVNLEEIWSSGALFQTDVPIRLGYFIEMRFHPGCLWSEHKYRPKHLFNPEVLLPNRMLEGTLHPPISPSDGLSPDAFAGAAALALIKQSPGNGSEAASR